MSLDSHQFPSLPSDFKDAAALVQKQLVESIKSLDTRVIELEAEAKNRKNIAILLKTVSVVSSLIILSGFASVHWAQILGGIITAIVALERVFANMNRLLAVSASIGAYERVRLQVKAAHNRNIINVIKIRDRKPEESADKLIQLVGQLRDQLAEVKEKVEVQLRQNEYTNLARLSLENENSENQS